MIAAARQDHPDLSVRRLCALLGVSRAWYYGHQRADLAAAEEATHLRDAIERLVLAFPGYGYRRVTKALQRDGWAINHKRVLRVMRREALLCQLKRRFVATTDSRHGCPTYPNLLWETVVARCDQAWVADITYVRLPTTFVYLACLLDAWSRRCVGWQLSRSIDARLTLAALDRAVATRHPAPGLIHHSDRGVQYASEPYRAILARHGLRCSMSRRGNCLDNAPMESFFGSLKTELVHRTRFPTREAARRAIFGYVEGFYNRRRRHSALGFLTPARAYEQMARAA